MAPKIDRRHFFKSVLGGIGGASIAFAKTEKPEQKENIIWDKAEAFPPAELTFLHFSDCSEKPDCSEKMVITIYQTSEGCVFHFPEGISYSSLPGNVCWYSGYLE